MGGVILKIATSRVGLMVLAAAAVWAWHVYDKRQAVAAAQADLVALSELTAAQAELEEERRMRAAAEGLVLINRRRADESAVLASQARARLEALQAEAAGTQGLTYPSEEDLKWLSEH